ncbi:uncharacterized protein B0T23DRAFT_418473 [Neurospora hispaniola]|uniref:Uncharacterized protein n=1 Tax=Neurospora hispaniola TaxID=588809 RepID=A0AAJ0ID36_9PEZI|nr:hypothetical protein B0T23DRAFT_418473 [Neurospora hispaniola]
MQSLCVCLVHGGAESGKIVVGGTKISKQWTWTSSSRPQQSIHGPSIPLLQPFGFYTTVRDARLWGKPRAYLPRTEVGTTDAAARLAERIGVDDLQQQQYM